MGSGAGNIYQRTYGSENNHHSEVESSNFDRQRTAAKPGAYRSQGKRATIERNVERVDKKFELHEDGYFCDRGTGRDESYRQYASTNPNKDAQELFTGLGRGGETQQMGNGKGFKTILDDMTHIVYRKETRTPNSPAVSIGRSASSKVKNQKIHFIEKSQ